MKGATEYRDAYCWFFGGREQSPDNFEEMIKQKIAGTYKEDDWAGMGGGGRGGGYGMGSGSFGSSFSEKSVPKFRFEIEAEEKGKITPTPKRIYGTNTPPPSSRKSIIEVKKEAKKQEIADKKYKYDGSRRSQFLNYGMGNVHPPNDDLFMTTYNIRADTGVNPHTVMKSRIRPYILSEYAKPKPVTCVKVHTPEFFASPKEMTKEEQLQMDGPFWVCWPSSKPFPKEYAQLESIVRPKPQ